MAGVRNCTPATYHWRLHTTARAPLVDPLPRVDLGGAPPIHSTRRYRPARYGLDGRLQEEVRGGTDRRFGRKVHDGGKPGGERCPAGDSGPRA
jgi:hypothetical protein